MNNGPVIENINLEEIDARRVEALELFWETLTQKQKRLFVQSCPEKFSDAMLRLYDFSSKMKVKI